jgi:dTDP-4-amino-4,6-dideoxy-D-galactose acyltransferase
MDYRLLSYDTHLLGAKVVTISASELDAERLASILTELRGADVALAYWAAARQLSDARVEALGGRLVDRKVTFAMALRDSKRGDVAMPVGVAPYDTSMPVADLERLALQCGEHSRFRVDPRFPRDKFVALYTTWIHRSLCKELADEVLTIRQGQHVVGMVTLSNENDRGNIGLIAVDESCRGKGYGEMLVRAAQVWFVAQGLAACQVVTQADNLAACRLYAKCGYTVERTEYYYHFWL